MKVHVNPSTKEILGYYPEDIEYPDLPTDLVDVSDEQYQQALETGATHWTDTGHETRVPPAPPPKTAEEQADEVLAAYMQNPLNASLVEVLESELPSHDLRATLRSHLVAHLRPAAWNSTTAYEIGDRVTHRGETWVATSNNIGNEPDEIPGDWDKV